MAVVVDAQTEGLRQLERAERLLEVGTGPRSRRTPVHKSLEQLFGEARARSQSYASAFASAPRLLQTPQAQRLERDVADFTLVAPQTAAAKPSTDVDQPSLSLQEFFSSRHERVIVETVEESYRDCLRSCERHSFDRLHGDWEEAKDAAIIDALLGETMGPPLVQRIAQLSSTSSPSFQPELTECWNIVSHELKMTLGGVTSGAIGYLQMRFFEEVKAFVYNHLDAHLGGIPDAWSLVKAHGRLKFQTSTFPSNATHVWYAAFVAARAGLTELLLELPQRAAPTSEQCPMLRGVCSLMAKRLQAADPSQPAALAGAQVDSADLLRADVEESSGFHDVLVSLLLGRGFAFGRLPEGTVEDWLWYRLHLVHLLGQDDDQSPEFKQQLEKLRYQAASLGPSHFDPVDGDAPGVASTAMQTLNSVKALLLTAQFGRAVQQLQVQDRSLRAVALHLALVLRRSGTLEALSVLEPALDVSAFVCDYASNFACRDQLQYFRALDAAERVKALQRLLLSGVGAGDELLGYIDPNGRHRPGLLERTLQEEGTGDQAEFVELCARAGRQACEQGQYREAIRLLHLGRCHSEVLQVLCRCLRLPIWREQDSQGEAMNLALQDIQRFFDIYERNLDRYALSSQVWAIARKLYAARMFHSFCDRGQPEAALDVFDREQLLALGSDSLEASEEIWAEYPRIVSDYIRVLSHAARGAMPTYALQERLRQLQCFLARYNRLVLDQETHAALAKLALCC
ncbi:unnamed protein product [Effrenium voratum]|uniref:Nuclear pore protein n=1 Tax=Effrenium voratum TaxID=2562239 RepID=A0AA36JM36_9DINO|nr:unnamed protein product [Effrenium voratum]